MTCGGAVWHVSTPFPAVFPSTHFFIQIWHYLPNYNSATTRSTSTPRPTTSLTAAATYNHSRPESDARCERIELTVVAPAMTDPLLYEWYINQGEQNCRLAFFFSATDGNLEVEREMLLENAVCFGIEEDYSIDHQSRRLLKLQIMAEEVSHNP